MHLVLHLAVLWTEQGPCNAGCTLLTAAVACGNVLGVHALLAKGASPDAPDGRGNTPLAIAAALGLCDAVKALLAAGADPDTVTQSGQEQPLRIAVHLWYASVRQALLRHGSAGSPDDDLCVSVNDDLTDRALGVVKASDDVFDFRDDIDDESSAQLEEGMVLGIVPEAGEQPQRTSMGAAAAAVAADAAAAAGGEGSAFSSMGGGSLLEGAESDGTEMSVTEVSAQTLVQTHSLQPIQVQAARPPLHAHQIDLEPSCVAKGGSMGSLLQPCGILSAVPGGDSDCKSGSSALLVAKSPRDSSEEEPILIIQATGSAMRGAMDAIGGGDSVVTLSNLSVESSLNSQDIAFGVGTRRHIFNVFALVQSKLVGSPCQSQGSDSSSVSCMAMTSGDHNGTCCTCRACRGEAGATCECAVGTRATLHDSLQSWPELEVSPEHRRNPHVVVVQQKATALRPYYRPDSFNSQAGCGAWLMGKAACAPRRGSGVSGCTGWSTSSSWRRDRTIPNSDQGGRPPQGCWTSTFYSMWTCMASCLPQSSSACHRGRTGALNCTYRMPLPAQP